MHDRYLIGGGTRNPPAPRAREPVKDVHERTVLDAEFEEIENRRARR